MEGWNFHSLRTTYVYNNNPLLDVCAQFLAPRSQKSKKRRRAEPSRNFSCFLPYTRVRHCLLCFAKLCLPRSLGTRVTRRHHSPRRKRIEDGRRRCALSFFKKARFDHGLLGTVCACCARLVLNVLWIAHSCLLH